MLDTKLKYAVSNVPDINPAPNCMAVSNDKAATKLLRFLCLKMLSRSSQRLTALIECNQSARAQGMLDIYSHNAHSTICSAFSIAIALASLPSILLETSQNS